MTRALERPLASRPTEPSPRRASWLRIGLVLLGIVLLGALVGRLDLEHDLSRLDAGLLSGVPEGNYHALADGLVRRARSQQGRLREVPSQGSMDNVARMLAARSSCEVAFAFAQDGSDWGEAGHLQLIGRLAKSESVFFLGKNAGTLVDLAQIAGARIGVGPERSGSAQLMARLFALPELAPLGVQLVHGTQAEELAAIERGELLMMVVVLDEDTPWLVNVMREGKLQMAGFAHLDVLARRLPHLRTGRIGAGQFDPIHLSPPEDRRVLRVDTLVVGNGCASRSTTLDLVSLLAQQFPDFIRHNRDTSNTTELALAPAAGDFFKHGERELADEYAPWLVDVMPPANWAYLAMGVSLLFNAMSFGHRFRLWRLDAARVKLEAEIAALFGPTTTLGDIARSRPSPGAAPAIARGPLEHIIKELEILAERCRRQSLSMLVPMGQEMTYRYQESLITETLAVLRAYLERGSWA